MPFLRPLGIWGCHHHHSVPGGPGSTSQGKKVKGPPAGLRVPGEDHLLGAAMSTFYAPSSPPNSEITRGLLALHWDPYASAEPEKLTKRTCTEREERLGQDWSWSLSILLNRQRYFTLMGEILVTSIGSSLNSCLGLCCHLSGQQCLCSIAAILSVFIILVCLNAVGCHLCGLIPPFHFLSISWLQKVEFIKVLSADKDVLRLCLQKATLCTGKRSANVKWWW